jgi:hypothetical protein
MNFDWIRQRVVLTGADQPGVAALASGLQQAGARVLAWCADPLAQGLTRSVVRFQGCATRSDDWQRLLGECDARWGGLDLLLHAGRTEASARSLFLAMRWVGARFVQHGAGALVVFGNGQPQTQWLTEMAAKDLRSHGVRLQQMDSPTAPQHTLAALGAWLTSPNC